MRQEQSAGPVFAEQVDEIEYELHPAGVFKLESCEGGEMERVLS